MKSKKQPDISLYLVTDRDLALGRSLEWVVEEAARGGVSMVQLREKNLETRHFIKEAQSIKARLKNYGIPLIINDRLDVAMAVGADGVHIGQYDMPPGMARRLLGPDYIIGLSVETYDQALEANEMDVDYVAISPVFTTPTKKELTHGLGIEGVEYISKLSLHPSVAIGSIKTDNAAKVIKAGAKGIAVVSGICSAEDPKKASAELAEIVRNAR